MKFTIAFFLVCLLGKAFCQLPYFSEVSDSLGMNYTYPGNDFQMVGGGVMVIDVNNDGWEDVFHREGFLTPDCG